MSLFQTRWLYVSRSAYCYPSSRRATVSVFTSSLLESKPTSFCRLCFSVTPSRRSRDGSSLNARPMLTGLGPPAASSPSSKPNLPRLIRFSDRSLLRAVQGRPGKRARATPWALKPATVAGGDNPPPDAAIIYYNNTDGARAEADSSDMRQDGPRAAKARDRKEPQMHHGKANFSAPGRRHVETLGDVAFLLVSGANVYIYLYVYIYKHLCTD